MVVSRNGEKMGWYEKLKIKGKKKGIEHVK